MEEKLAELLEEIGVLQEDFLPQMMFGNEAFGLTQYIFWMFVALAIMLIVVFAAAKRMSLVPKGRFMNGFEFVVEFVRDDILKANLGHTADKHAPFLLTMFFFIVANNIVGVIPGCKPGTGTIGVTVALASVSFVYFIAVAIKHMGVVGYIKSFAPKGVVLPLAIMVGCIEFISTLLRLVTLAVRLFANMFAGHIALGCFALMTGLWLGPIFTSFCIENLLTGLPGIAWFLILTIIYAIELVVAVIQAYVFTLLSAVYIQLSESEH